ncbi:uncharacterized protein TNCV_5142131 [Trichonephila clavipes]|nr:uncharacterized protein TNCV_5142131 [Trichonephila clavipes]
MHDCDQWAVGSLVVRASDSRPEGLGSMLDVTKYPPSAHGFTCRNCGGGGRGRVAIYRPFGEVSLSLNCTVTCMVLKANDRRTSCPCHDEFRGPRSDYVRQPKGSLVIIDTALLQAHSKFRPKPQKTYRVVVIGKRIQNVENEDMRLSESDCKESEESADVIDNIPVNPDTY